MIQVEEIEYFYNSLSQADKEKIHAEIAKQIRNTIFLRQDFRINILGVFKHIHLPKCNRNPNINKNFCLEMAKEKFPDKCVMVKMDGIYPGQSNQFDICIIYEFEHIEIKKYLENVFKNFVDDDREIVFYRIDDRNRLHEKKVPVNTMLNILTAENLVRKFCCNPGGELKCILEFTENHLKQYFLNPDLYIYEFHHYSRSKTHVL